MNQQIKEKIKSKHFSSKNKTLIKTNKIRLPLKDSRIAKSMRESKWNNRFIYSKIPNYDALKDKNVIYSKNFSNYFNFKKIDHYLNSKSTKNYSLNQTNLENIGSKKENYYSPKNEMNKKNMSARNTFSLGSKNYLSPIQKHCINIDNPSLINLKKLWDELEVLKPYRNYFNYIYKELETEYKEELYQKEIQELNKVKINIKALKYHIALRLEIIEEIKLLNDKLGKELLNKNNNSKELLLNQISDKIIILREQTIKVCQSMKKLKECLFTINNLDKYDLDLISKKYKFDKNYIIKMKSELNFLKEGFTKYYFNIENDQTPFLLKASDKNQINKQDYFIRVIPINDEVKKEIIDCIFYVHQEFIAYQTINYHKKDFKRISPIRMKEGDLNHNIKKQNNNEDANTTISNPGWFTDREKKIKINGLDINNKNNKTIEGYIKNDIFENNQKLNGNNTNINIHNNVRKNMNEKIRALIEEDDTYPNLNKKENYDKDQFASDNYIGNESKTYMDKNQSSIIIKEKKNENESKVVNNNIFPFTTTEEENIKTNNKITDNQIINS